MNQKLSDWAIIAQIVSGIAVVMTLVFLIIEIRSNTSVTRAAAFQGHMSELNQLNLSIIEDGALASAWVDRRNVNFSDLDQEESSQLLLLYRTMFRSYDAAYYSWIYGSLSDDQWARFSEVACRNALIMKDDPGLWSRIAVIVSDDFLTYLEQDCAA